MLLNIIVGEIFDAKMGGLEMQKLTFRIIRVARYEVWVFWERHRK